MAPKRGERPHTARVSRSESRLVFSLARPGDLEGDMPDEDDSGMDFGEYESGPFCQHFSDPSSCDEKCANCGHSCQAHGSVAGELCNEDGCECQGFVDA